MIRVLLGRFFGHCIERARQRDMRIEASQIDLASMSDREISAFLHGRTPRSVSAAAEAHAALARARRQLDAGARR